MIPQFEGKGGVHPHTICGITAQSSIAFPQEIHKKNYIGYSVGFNYRNRNEKYTTILYSFLLLKLLLVIKYKVKK